jgi:hypothetical protein
MNNQFLQYVREMLMVATADLHGKTKGQLQAFAENPGTCVDRFKRKRPKIEDEVTGKMLTVYSDPIPGAETRCRKQPMPLIEPSLFSTASWRRALMALDEPERAWLSYCYGHDLTWSNQVAMVEWVWEAFKESLGCKKMAGKTLHRLRALAWLAVQDAGSELMGRECIQHQRLAMITGVSKPTWSESYSPHWLAMREIVMHLDRKSLSALSKTRLQQKSENFDGYCKPELNRPYLSLI